jgi:hypothetical protein
MQDFSKLIDKNSLWGGFNIQKKEFKGILAQDLWFVLGHFQRSFEQFLG